MSTLSVRTLLLSAASAFTGCSLVYSDTLDKKQCDVDDDCGGGALRCVDEVCQGPGDGVGGCTLDTDCGQGERCGYDNVCYAKWACLDAPADWPTPTQPFRVSTLLRRIDAPGMEVAAVGEVDAIACATSDATCANPLVRADQITLDADKKLEIPFNVTSGSGLVSGFVGMVKIQPRQADAYLPSYLHATSATPWVSDFSTARETVLGSAATTGLLQQLLGVEVDPNGGIAMFAVYDCGGKPAAGVQIVPTTAGEVPFFPLAPGFVPLIGEKATTDEGVGVLLDLQANKLEVFQLREQATQRVLAQSVSLIVQGGGFNFVNFYPRYSALQAGMKAKR